MSILIKGMEMPKRCWDCFAHCDVDIGVGIADGCELLKAMIYDPDERLEDCPLVPVPKHGRTIDADAFKKRMMQGAIDAREDALTDEIWLHILDAAKSLCLDIDEQPTIIPADKEGEK